MAAGTLKNGAAVAANTTCVWKFSNPAGKRKTMKTQKEPSVDSDLGQSAMHGEGSSAPYAIAEGNGEATWKTEIAQHEYFELVEIARAAGIPLTGVGGLKFDQVATTVVNGLPKMTQEARGCSIGKVGMKRGPEGNMVSLEGMCTNVYDNGVARFV